MLFRSVFKNIAEQTFVRNNQLDVSEVRVDSLLAINPNIKSGNLKKTKTVLSKLKIKPDNNSDSDWVSIDKDSVSYQLNDILVEPNSVPRVIGMGAKDAVFLLEQSGLRVSMTGSGKVVSQSIAEGDKQAKGKTIRITLR